jgi:putative tryptophan/tyrosine transport system substrate-binding protein
LGVRAVRCVWETNLTQARRRRFLISASTLLATPLYGLAQPSAGTIARIGFLGVSTPAAWGPRVDAFRAGLRDLGYVEGRNIIIEFRFAEGKFDRLPELAAELVRLKVDVIVTHSGPGALAAKQATAKNPIPVVMTNVGDAVGSGIVASLSRPGGNITGDTFYVTELVPKRLELLKDAIPRVRRVAILSNPDNPATTQYLSAVDTAAKELNVALPRFDTRVAADLDGAFVAMAKEGVDALAVIEDVVLITNFKRIAELAVQQRLPSISFVEYPDAGGLFGYGVNFLALYRRASVFVDKILKGANPGEIPIERPTKFEFVINMKTAKALGLSLPTATLLRADRAI